VDGAVDADEDPGDGDDVGVSVGSPDGTSEALNRETADRTSSRNLKRAPFSGTALSQRAKMQPCSLETFGGAIGAPYATLKRRAKRVRKRADSAGERIVMRGGVRREQATKRVKESSEPWKQAKGYLTLTCPSSVELMHL